MLEVAQVKLLANVPRCNMLAAELHTQSHEVQSNSRAALMTLQQQHHLMRSHHEIAHQPMGQVQSCR